MIMNKSHKGQVSNRGNYGTDRAMVTARRCDILTSPTSQDTQGPLGL